MSDSATEETHPILQPFSFDGWNGEHITAARVDFAARCADQHAADADQSEQHGDKALANTEREAALWWRGLEHLTGAEGEAAERDAWLDATERINVLLARANVSDSPLRQLCVLAEQIHEGLNAIAAHGNQAAAAALLGSLFRSVDNFNMVAFHTPEVFKPAAASYAGIPGIISPHTEKTDANAHLVKRLDVAVEYNPLRRRRQKLPRVFSTASNLWASRLYHYIVGAQIQLKARGLRATQPGEVVPDWYTPAMLLQPFSAATWGGWADVAWLVVIEATAGEPERQSELFPIGASAARKVPKYGSGIVGERTQSSNVRTKIKELLRGAFKKLAGA